MERSYGTVVLSELDRLLACMSEKRRIVFQLFVMEGYSGMEIANLLGVPVNTVKTRLYYARKDFAKLWAQHQSVGASET